MWKGCQFVSGLVRALGKLRGGIGRFLPCSFGGHMSTETLRLESVFSCFDNFPSDDPECCVAPPVADSRFCFPESLDEWHTFASGRPDQGIDSDHILGSRVSQGNARAGAPRTSRH